MISVPGGMKKLGLLRLCHLIFSGVSALHA